MRLARASGWSIRPRSSATCAGVSPQPERLAHPASKPALTSAASGRSNTVLCRSVSGPPPGTVSPRAVLPTALNFHTAPMRLRLPTCWPAASSTANTPSFTRRRLKGPGAVFTGRPSVLRSCRGPHTGTHAGQGGDCQRVGALAPPAQDAAEVALDPVRQAFHLTRHLHPHRREAVFHLRRHNRVLS